MTFEIPDPKKIEIPDSIFNIISLCDEAKKDFDTSGELTDERQEEIWLKAKDDRLVSSAQIENIMVRKGVTLQFANLQSLEYAETKNIDEKELLNLLIADKELYERAKEEKSTISKRLIKEIHSIISKDSPKYRHPDFIPGEFAKPGKTHLGARVVTNADWEPVYWGNIESYIDDTCRLYNKSLGKIHPIILACWLHHVLTRIHPFFDGNGRISRLFQDFTLMCADYIPVSIGEQTKNDYLNLLKEADDGDYSPLIRVMTENVINQYKNSLDVIVAIEEEEKARKSLLSMFRSSRDSEHNKVYLAWETDMKFLTSRFKESIDRWNEDFKNDDLPYRFNLLDWTNNWNEKAFNEAKGRAIIPRHKIFSIWFYANRKPSYEFMCYAAKHKKRPDQDFEEFNVVSLYFSSRSLIDDPEKDNPNVVTRKHEVHQTNMLVDHDPLKNEIVTLREVFWHQRQMYRYLNIPSKQAYEEKNKVLIADLADERWEFCSKTRENKITPTDVVRDALYEILSYHSPT